MDVREVIEGLKSLEMRVISEWCFVYKVHYQAGLLVLWLLLELNVG